PVAEAVEGPRWLLIPSPSGSSWLQILSTRGDLAQLSSSDTAVVVMKPTEYGDCAAFAHHFFERADRAVQPAGGRSGQDHPRFGHPGVLLSLGLEGHCGSSRGAPRFTARALRGPAGDYFRISRCARQRSYLVCRFIQNSGVVSKKRASSSAVSGVIPRLP